MNEKGASGNERRRVQVLSDSVARKIAAGEVIDRPHAAVRELLDNAIDAGSTDISLHLIGGGIDEIRVSDNGLGMEQADLEVCWLPHATSKISSVEDLEEISTLGFRGEALSSLAACSRLEIVSNRDGEAIRLSVHGGKMLELEPHRGAPGTTVSAKNLFFNMPARRRFLKSARGEGGLCRRIFLEKAAAHPERSFRYFSDGVLKLFLPAGSALERVEAAWPRLAPGGALWETQGEGPGFSATIVHARPEVSRKDRQYIQIYANRRRIDEFALVQAVQYAYDAWMPGGAFPVAFLFLEIDPALVDFNIHPAKKEARFRDLPAIRHRLIEVLKDRLTGEAYRQRAERTLSGETQTQLIQEEESSEAEKTNAAASAESGDRKPMLKTRSDSERAASERRGIYTSYARGDTDRPGEEAADTFAGTTTRLRENKGTGSRLERFSPTVRADENNFRYLGQVMGVFLLAESRGSLFVVDQHAAHERILYEKFRDSDPGSERLLIPRKLSPDRRALMRLELRSERLAALGIEIDRNAEGEWELVTLPAAAQGMEDDIVEFLESGAGDAEGLEKALWADLSCKAAVKDNSVLDDESARRLLTEAFALETPRCPHGRPIWFEVSRNELFELVGRTV